jgi:hypothetical protein
MSLNVGLRIRVLALAALVVAVAIGASTVMLSRADRTVAPADDRAEASAAPARRAVQPQHAAVTVPPDVWSRNADPLRAQAIRPAVRPATKSAAPPVKRSGGTLPGAVAAALQRHPVVVVSLVSPSAAVDQLALREAQAGAKLAGAGFVSVDVLVQGDMERLTRAFSVRHTPSVLVLTSPGKLFVEIDGFVDKETVAQAATNARS